MYLVIDEIMRLCLYVLNITQIWICIGANIESHVMNIFLSWMRIEANDVESFLDLRQKDHSAKIDFTNILICWKPGHSYVKLKSRSCKTYPFLDGSNERKQTSANNLTKFIIQKSSLHWCFYCFLSRFYLSIQVYISIIGFKICVCPISLSTRKYLSEHN